MLQNSQSIKSIATFVVILLFANTISYTQSVERVTPKWWIGLSGAANINYYRGTTQQLNQSLTVPTAFHQGKTVRPYGSILLEYRPNKVVGLMLNTAFDNRGSQFDDVIAPCDCPASLYTNLSYVAIEPSIRIAPFKSSFYVFAGPTIGININKAFKYTQDKQPDIHADFNSINKNVIAAQAGLGFDIPVSAKRSETQMTVSPFASFQTDYFDAPRSVETWTIYTVRAGVALKFGTAKRAIVPAKTKIIMVEAVAPEKEIQFYVRAPKVFPSTREVKETFPLRNSIFFNIGETQIASRYIQLNATEIGLFKEEQLQTLRSKDLYFGRSARQLEVYHHILNILGDRMRRNADATIILVGSSDNNPTEGALLASNVKAYLVDKFKIDANRITTVGRDKPVIPSEQPYSTNQLDLLHEGDRRVDIESNSASLLMEFGEAKSGYLKPVQIISTQHDPLDSYVIFTTAGATELLASWNVMLTDERGNIQQYGPFTLDQASVSGKRILGNDLQGNYNVVMTGVTKNGKKVKKTSIVSLTKPTDTKQEGLRYSILFDFDKSKSIASYENFLFTVVAPLVSDNDLVIIHGHTDIIGDEKYNHTLSHERADGVHEILRKAFTASAKKGVKFEIYGFGEDVNSAPFENSTPEERFYNRTVIIDIIPFK
jgi:outer membrane protein OmpA-like peptidoglycan-associated protein